MTCGNVKWFSHYGKQRGSSSKIKHRLSTWPSNSTPRSILPQTGNRCSDRNSYMNAHGSSIHNIQVVWTTQISRKRSVNKQIVVYPCNGILFSHKNEWSIDACYNEVPWNHDAMLQKPDTKFHILFDFIYKKYPK